MKEKIKKNKGFIQIPILIAIIVCIGIISGGSYFGYIQFKNYQFKQAEKEKQSQELITSQQKALDEANKALEDSAKKISDTEKTAQEESDRQGNIANQTNIKYKYVTRDTSLGVPGEERSIGNIAKGTKVILLSEIKDGFSTVKVGEQVGLIYNNYLVDSMAPDIDISALVQKWKPFVVYIVCNFKYTDGTTYLTKSGSGTDYDGVVITNRHIIVDDNGYGPSSCSLKFPGSSHIFIVQNSEIRVATNGDDWGTITVLDKKSYIDNKPIQGLYGCSVMTPSVGDEVLVLGYPSIGSQTDVTATRGIISGKEDNYFITDAKIDFGNSGGTAILMKGDCYLGIPTYVIKGQIESLGRILDIQTVPIVGLG